MHLLPQAGVPRTPRYSQFCMRVPGLDSPQPIGFRHHPGSCSPQNLFSPSPPAADVNSSTRKGKNRLIQQLVHQGRLSVPTIHCILVYLCTFPFLAAYHPTLLSVASVCSDVDYSCTFCILDPPPTSTSNFHLAPSSHYLLHALN